MVDSYKKVKKIVSIKCHPSSLVPDFVEVNPDLGVTLAFKQSCSLGGLAKKIFPENNKSSSEYFYSGAERTSL